MVAMAMVYAHDCVWVCRVSPGGIIEYFKSNAAGIEYGEGCFYKEYFENRMRFQT